MHYEGINIFCPTKGRSATKLPAFVKSALEKAAGKDSLYFTFVVNANDNETLSYLEAEIPSDRLSIIFENEPECNLSLFFNRCYSETKFQNENLAVSLFGDDMVFVTKNWDKLMLDKLNDSCGLGIVYGDDDNVQHGDNCVYFITSRRLVEMTGKPFMCPMFKVEWIDDVWYMVGKKLNLLEYMPYLHIKHNHSMNVDVGMDKTFIEMRKLAGAAAKDSGKIDGYTNEIVANINTHLNQMRSRKDVAVMMTTYDRVYLFLKTVKSISESVLLPETIHVYNDGGSDRSIAKIRKYTSGNGFEFHDNPHVGCEKNHRRAFKEIFGSDNIEWTVVIDSDSVLYKFWYIKVLDMLDEIPKDVAIIGLFNKGDRNVSKEAPKGYEYKNGVGGIGMVISRTAASLIPSDDRLKIGWDNQVCEAALVRGYSIISPNKSYIQHTGYIEGIHASDRFDEAVAKNFCGDIPEEEDQKQIVEGNSIMVCCMARKVDCVYAAIMANSFAAAGVKVKWLTIPHNVRLIENLIEGVQIKSIEPFSGNPYDTYSEATSYSMEEKFKNFDKYVNLQMCSRENSGLYRNSDLEPIVWLKRKMKRYTSLSMDEGEKIIKRRIESSAIKNYFKNNSGKKNVLILGYAEDGPVDMETVRSLWDKYCSDDKCVTILLSLNRLSDVPGNRSRQIYHLDDREIISLVNESDMVIGLNSWVMEIAKIAGKV